MKSKCIFCKDSIKAPTQENERWCWSCDLMRKTLLGVANLTRNEMALSKKSREYWVDILMAFTDAELEYELERRKDNPLFLQQAP